MIKFWSYDREYIKYKNSILKNVNKTLKKGNIFFGNQLETFEKNFIKRYKSKYGIAVGSGTDALLISLKTLKRPSLSLFSGGVSSWKKSLYDWSWTSRKSGYSTKFFSS